MNDYSGSGVLATVTCWPTAEVCVLLTTGNACIHTCKLPLTGMYRYSPVLHWSIIRAPPTGGDI